MMCSNKEVGGMGFRQIELFNQAMLAKQSWRILRNSNSLLVKILRGRYFNDRCFLKAKLGNNPSLTWRSICRGRDLFLKGYRWKVGIGNMITIYKDPWINRREANKPLMINDSLKDKRVNFLIDEQNNWKDELILQNFSAHDANDILSIPLGDKASKDIIIWSLDRKKKDSLLLKAHIDWPWQFLNSLKPLNRISLRGDSMEAFVVLESYP